MKTIETPLSAWSIDARTFPYGGTPEQQLYFALRYAVLAPSSHNSQPWLFQVRHNVIEVLADRSRALPVVDPEDRELVISCGAALYTLRLALRAFGHDAAVETFPETEQPDLLARVTLAGTYQPTEEEWALFLAIQQRHTNRQPFVERDVPASLEIAMRAAVQQEGALLYALHESEERFSAIELMEEADHLQWSDRHFRRELAAWSHANRSRSFDGMPGYASGVDDLRSYLTPLLMQRFDLSDSTAERDARLAASSPLLAVLGTQHDSPTAWLKAGQALQRLLLRATMEGVSASFFNQPIEVPALRPNLADVAGGMPYPQILLRVGYAPPARPTPRRPLEDMLLLVDEQHEMGTMVR
jgi:hypothetical protein